MVSKTAPRAVEAMVECNIGVEENESGDYYWRDCRRRCDCGHWHEDVRTIILGHRRARSDRFLRIRDGPHKGHSISILQLPWHLQ
eukprot:s963_g19.t1